MKTDSIFYQLFQTFPRCFFDLLNLPAETVNDYQFSSKEAIAQGKKLIQKVKEEIRDAKQQEKLKIIVSFVII